MSALLRPDRQFKASEACRRERNRRDRRRDRPSAAMRSFRHVLGLRRERGRRRHRERRRRNDCESPLRNRGIFELLHFKP